MRGKTLSLLGLLAVLALTCAAGEPAAITKAASEI